MLNGWMDGWTVNEMALGELTVNVLESEIESQMREEEMMMRMEMR